MFEHSVKVPRRYKVAANIFKKVSTEGGSFKTLLYDDKLRHFRTNVLYALLTETIKHAADIDKIFERSGLVAKEPRLNLWLAKVLTAELLFGKQTLPGKSKPEQTILSYKDEFEKYIADHQEDFKIEVVRRPRYVRINTNLLTTSDAIRAFKDEGYRFIRCTSGSYNDYLTQIQNLTEYDFTQDYHVKTVFVFASGTKLHDHKLYKENMIILQDKATTLAVHLLAAPPGSVALDMCAAPGMKTTQLAAYMRNQGKIYSVERNQSRYRTLCHFVEKTGSTCVETLHRDALDIWRGEYEDVEYILLDPSCSGSGMELSVHDYVEESRLAKLTSLQEKFLKHAMNAFPNAKRIVYSTCSLFPEENERVITNVVKTSRAKWRVRDVKELLKGQWNNVGSGMYGSMGARCLYAKPDTDFTTGFFLAVLDRDQKDLENRIAEVNFERKANDESVTSKKKMKHKKNRADNVSSEHNDVTVVDNGVIESEIVVEDIPHKKNKRKHKNKDICEESAGSLESRKTDEDANIVIDTEFVESEPVTEDTPQKKKKRKHTAKDLCDENVASLESGNNIETSADAENPPKKKKRKPIDNGEHNDIAYIQKDSKKKKNKRKGENDMETEDTEEVIVKNKKKKHNKKAMKEPEELVQYLDSLVLHAS